MDLFKKAMTVCAAVSVFGVGAYVAVSGADAISVAKVKAVMASESAARLDSVLVEPSIPTTVRK